MTTRSSELEHHPRHTDDGSKSSSGSRNNNSGRVQMSNRRRAEHTAGRSVFGRRSHMAQYSAVEKRREETRKKVNKENMLMPAWCVAVSRWSSAPRCATRLFNSSVAYLPLVCMCEKLFVFCVNVLLLLLVPAACSTTQHVTALCHNRAVVDVKLARRVHRT